MKAKRQKFRVDEPWIQTFTGKAVQPQALKESDVDMRDIAHALSNLCRFTGHCSTFYSVAEHSVLVSLVAQEAIGAYGALYGSPRIYAGQALFHDAAEAYLADIAAPLKRLPEFSGYKKLEARVKWTIDEALGVRVGGGALRDEQNRSWENPEQLIREADLLVLMYEAERLLLKPPKSWNITSKLGGWRDFAVLQAHSPGMEPRAAKALFLDRAKQVGVRS